MGWTPGTETWPKVDNNYNPNQKEIEFFWPLTEQIALPLDYTGCDTKSLIVVPVTCGTGLTLSTYGSNNQTWSTYIVTDKIETSEINFTLTEKPFIIKRLLFKLLGINWKIK